MGGMWVGSGERNLKLAIAKVNRLWRARLKRVARGTKAPVPISFNILDTPLFQLYWNNSRTRCAFAPGADQAGEAEGCGLDSLSTHGVGRLRLRCRWYARAPRVCLVRRRAAVRTVFWMVAASHEVCVCVYREVEDGTSGRRRWRRWRGGYPARHNPLSAVSGIGAVALHVALRLV